MKVLYLLGSLNRGGLETLILDILNNSDKADFMMHCIHRHKGSYIDDFYKTRVNIKQLTPKMPLDPFYILKLRRYILKNKISHVHAQMWLDAFYAQVALVGINIPIILSNHGYIFEENFTQKIIGKILRNCRCNIFVSEFQKQFFIKKYNLISEKCRVVYNGINFDKLNNITLKTELPVNHEESIKLGMVGNFVPGRDQMTVCRFLNLLHKHNINFDFYFVGKKNESSPSLYDDCVNYCKDNNLNSVHFLGGRGDVPAILNKLDAFIYSTNHDTFGIAVIEAIASGIPTFVNDWCVMKEITEDGELAIIYKTNDAEDLYNKFSSYLKNKGIILKSAKIKAIKTRNKYSIERHLAKLYNVYIKF